MSRPGSHRSVPAAAAATALLLLLFIAIDAPTASRVGAAAASFVLFTVILSTVLLAVASVPGTPSPQEEAVACSEARPVLESQPDPTWEGPQSVEPELFTPTDSF